MSDQASKDARRCLPCAWKAIAPNDPDVVECNPEYPECEPCEYRFDVAAKFRERDQEIERLKVENEILRQELERVKGDNS